MCSENPTSIDCVRHVQSLSFLPHSTARFAFLQASFPTSPRLSALSFCNVIGYLAIFVHKQLTIPPNYVLNCCFLWHCALKIQQITHDSHFIHGARAKVLIMIFTDSFPAAALGLQLDDTRIRCKIMFTLDVEQCGLFSFPCWWPKSHLRLQVVPSVSKVEAGVKADIRYGSSDQIQVTN